jgi:cytochrome c peroxidase
MVTRQHLGPIVAIERATEPDPEHLALGEALFHDRRLSGNGKLACSSCHDLTQGGVDHGALAIGLTGEPGAHNTPTVFNSALNFRQFWDGRAASLDEPGGPLLAGHEMGATWPDALAALGTGSELSSQFARSYPEGLTADSANDALSTFVSSLATPDAPFDRYLAGDARAIDPSARRGYELFTSYGCSACHQGQAVGGNMFQKLGIMSDYFANREHETTADQGRFNVTHDEVDRHVFKVPSLRNVARTAPYFHDGSISTLGDAVRVMAHYQLGRDLENADVANLVAFLESLTGVYKGRSL